MAKRSILTEQPRDFISQEKSGDKIIFRNPRTNQVVELPRDATAHERRLTIKSLQEQTSDPFAGVKAAEGLDRMARGGEPAPAADDDAEPYVPVGASPNSPYRLRAERLHAEWAERQRQKSERARQLDDLDRLSDKVAEKLGAQLKAAEQSAEPSADDLAAYLPPELNLTWEQFKAKAEANGAGESGGSADAA